MDSASPDRDDVQHDVAGEVDHHPYGEAETVYSSQPRIADRCDLAGCPRAHNLDNTSRDMLADAFAEPDSEPPQSEQQT